MSACTCVNVSSIDDFSIPHTDRKGSPRCERQRRGGDTGATAANRSADSQMVNSNSPPAIRRDGRVAEGARLESVFRGNSNVGSNPTLSATPLRRAAARFAGPDPYLPASIQTSISKMRNYFDWCSCRMIAARSLSSVNLSSSARESGRCLDTIVPRAS